MVENNFADLLERSMEADIRKLDQIKPAARIEYELSAAIASSRILITDNIPEPPRCLAINQDGELATIGTLGNFSMVIGKAKSKKSFTVQMLINAALDQYSTGSFITSTLPEGKRNVLVIDTEQGGYRTQKILKRANYQVTNHTGNLFAYDLRPYTVKQRLEMTEEIIYSTSELGLVFIDGARDLVSDINDQTQATEISSKLLKWTSERNIHICVILHQNKGDANARGHLGSELVNKAETTLSVTKDPDDDSLSYVEAEYCRDKEFKPFAIRIDDQGHPAIVPGLIKTEIKKTRKAWAPENYPPHTHVNVLSRIWPTPTSEKLKYADFRERIRLEFLKEGVTIGHSYQKQLVTYYFNKEMVQKNANPIPLYSLMTDSKT